MEPSLAIQRAVACAVAATVIATPLLAATHPCPPPLAKAHAKCVTVTVAEDPSKPNGRKIGLNVVVVPALKKKAGEAAMFYAGPGSVYRQHRDVVTFDQRGTGASNPLRCPELEKHGPLVEMYPPDEVKACRETLEKTADLTQYSTELAADDVDAIRRADEAAAFRMSARRTVSRVPCHGLRLRKD